MTDQDTMAEGLDAILRPRSVAVVGASRDPESMSGRLFRNLRASFAGPVYPVNPHAGTVESSRAYSSILDVPGPVDLAVVAVPAAHAVAAVRDCLGHGVRGLVVITAGFTEVGGAGEANQAEILALARGRAVRMVGPNCLGVLNTDPAVRLNATFSGFPFPQGNIGIATQSGALGFVLPDLLRASQAGLSHLISLGNKADLNENDVVAYWGDDPRTDVGLLYLESFADPRGFVEVARGVARRKPIVVLKAGRTAAGTRAAGSHTAALASPAAAAEAVLRQAGVIRADDIQGLADVAVLLATQPVPAGRRVAVLTNAGGPGVVIADALEEQGFSVPPLSDTLQGDLRALVRAEARVGNPVDLVGSNDPELYARCLRLLLGSDEAEAVVAMFVPLRPGDSERVARAVMDLRRRTPSPRKTLVAVFVESRPPTGELAGGDLTIPAFPDPGRAARALGRVVAYDESRRREKGKLPELGGIDATAVRGIIETHAAGAPAGGTWLPAPDVQRLLAACGLAAPRWGMASSADEAAELGERLGGPVVLKVDSPSVLHKRAAGGVAANVLGGDALRTAFRRLTAAVPDTRGVFVQQFVPQGVDALVGLTREPSFGHLVGCGVGGSLAEALGRVDFRLHPLTDRDADDLVRENPVGRLLASASAGRAPGPGPLRDVVLRVSALAGLAPEIGEADLNPVRILPDGTALVLDARVRIT